MSAKTVGFVGLGVMGLPMARNVIRGGHAVVGYDLNPRVLEELAAADGRVVDSAAAAARGSDLVITMVPNPEDVEAAVLGVDGIADGIEDGAVVVVMSTIDPPSSVRVHDRLQERGIRMIEAPVTRSSQHAIDGELGILVGGEAEDLEAARPVLECMGTDITHCGPIGTGSAMKLVNNMLAMTIQTVTAEALAYGLKAGLSLETLHEVLGGTAASNPALHGPMKKVAKRYFEPGFMVRLGQKDLRLAVKYASELGAMTHLGSVTHQMLAQANARGYGAEDTSAVAKLYEEAAGVEIREGA
jgi:4-hydroxybutyrate dehydrogenase / sulfolactaldehyde 3-reductase